MKGIGSKDELDAFVRSLNTEISRIWEHWTVLNGIHQSVNEYWLEMNESNQFWRIVSRALADTVIVRIAAAVDRGDTVVSVPNLLRLLRKQSNPTTSFLTAKQLAALHCADLENDIDETDSSEPIINKVRKHRDKLVAHRDMSIIVNDALQEMPELPDDEIEGLILKLHRIVSKYCRIIDMNPIVLGCPGGDDYEHLLDLLRAGFNTQHPNVQQRLSTRLG